MSQRRKLIVTTLMSPQGETGVQTHFNAIIKAATRQGLDVQLVHPYADHLRIVRKVMTIPVRLLTLFNKELSVIVNRWAHYWLLKFQLKRILDQDLEAVVYAQDPLSCRAALANKTPRQPVVCVAHFNISEVYEVQTKGLSQEGGSLCRHLQQNESEILPKADKIIFVSACMRAEVNDRLPTIKTVPQAVIANFIEDKASTKPTTMQNAELITIGSLETRKNQAFILNVLANAHARGHRYRLTIIGNGPDREMLEKLAADLHLSDSINFLGFQANASIFIPGHKVYLHAALMENLPITLLEALSHGLPVIAPAVGGIPEVFCDGHQGYFWPLDNLEVATDRLCEVLENETLRARLSIQARDHFVSHFSEQALANTWLQAILDA